MAISVYDQATWRDAVHELASFERPSASEGERRAAEWIAARLRKLGYEAVIERERAVGGYWWPIGLANALALAGAVLSRGKKPARGRGARRLAGAALAGAAAAALWDDLGHGSRWFRRMFFSHRDTWNVVAAAGDLTAKRTVVLVAHHDAAHSGLVFHPALGRIPPRIAPELHERSDQWVPILYAVWLGPVAIALGAALRSGRLLRAGSALALGTIGAMADVGSRSVVPGANDNLAAVGLLLALGDALKERPLEGVRVLLVSTGSEESFSEGMQAFGERHFKELDPSQTEFLCLECVGGPTLIVLEGEGMLRMRDYPAHTREALAAAAARAGVTIERGLHTVAATDALISLRAGYPTVTLASVDYTKLPLNYHWPSDTPDALHWGTVEDAIAVTEEFVRSAARRRATPA
jgi:acetylornithine deacetylase/succinyl-diaminopimelate desuccinylase-like protein